MVEQTKAEIAERLLREENKELTIHEIARLAIERRYHPSDEIHKVTSGIGSAISSDIKKKKAKSLFRRVSNGKGGYKKGIYKLKKERKTGKQKAISSLKKTDPTFIPTVSTLYVGKGGEFAVMSELLFRGFNAVNMTVDDGIDVVASKDNEFYFIQVKTLHFRGNNMSFELKTKSFDQYNKMKDVYVFVIRFYETKSNARNHFIILNGTEIKKYLETGLIERKNDKLKLSLQLNDDKITLKKGSTLIDLTYHLNNFESLG